MHNCGYVKRTTEARRVVGDGSDQIIVLSHGTWEIMSGARDAYMREDGELPVRNVLREQYLPANQWYQIHIDRRDRRIAISISNRCFVYFRKIVWVPVIADAGLNELGSSNGL